MRSDPYLWLHLAGMAAFPIFLELTGLGLSIGDPLPFFWLELVFLVIFGIVPVVLMQWFRPFSIYCLILVSLTPSTLTENQRRVLSRFKTPKHRFLTLITAIAMMGVLWFLYQSAPLGAMVTLKLPQWRILGLLIAAVSFVLANLFIQIPVSVLGVLTTPLQTFDETPPYPQEIIEQQFSILGLRLKQIPLMPKTA